ncbi:hypothetical protein E2C01_086785 [Portunus trituberculatus]|uniref:Uncharacterized protein n=1 Tax=Portunus trituberculatus TaxID=210409 RepID=A0A5B7JA81_PORTR|nr:hypothetical protein [Portunus trituberculatus]
MLFSFLHLPNFLHLSLKFPSYSSTIFLHLSLRFLHLSSQYFLSSPFSSSFSSFPSFSSFIFSIFFIFLHYFLHIFLFSSSLIFLLGGGGAGLRGRYHPGAHTGAGPLPVQPPAEVPEWRGGAGVAGLPRSGLPVRFPGQTCVGTVRGVGGGHLSHGKCRCVVRNYTDLRVFLNTALLHPPYYFEMVYLSLHEVFSRCFYGSRGRSARFLYY